MIRRAVVCVVLVGACQVDQPHPPITPGGPGGIGSSGSQPDGAVDSGDGNPIVARVCVVDDLRDPATNCATTGADGITVTLGNESATTAADGTFTIAPAIGTSLQWRVSAPNLITSVIPFSADLVLPAIDASRYADLLLANGIVLAADVGGALVRVRTGGSAAIGARVATTPTPQFTLYDSSLADQWQVTATGGFGAAWLVGLPAGLTAITVTPAQGQAVSDSLGIEPPALTLVTVVFQ